MNEIEYANIFLGEYKVKGNEIIPKFCPFCNGGVHRDPDTFALNTEKHTYNCLRGSCGKNGHFSELLRMVGEKMETSTIQYMPPKKLYKLSTEVVIPPTDKVIAYIKSRGITQEIASVYGIGAAQDGNIIFPFYRTVEDFQNKNATFIKFRKPEKFIEGRKMWREKDTEPILFGMHLCSADRTMLYITEGEFDCMCVYQATEGCINIVSVPSGAQDFTWIETCAEFLSGYENISFLGDADAPGLHMLSDLNKKLEGKTVCAPDFSTYHGCKDANEILHKYGKDAFVEILASMKPMPVEGLINLAEVRSVDISQIPRTVSGIASFDATLGGFLEGDLTIWTGKRGEGKSSFLNQIALEAIDRGINVCIYSGEVPADRMKYQIGLCAAGKLNIESRLDPFTGKEIFAVNYKKRPVIEAWYNRKIWLYDNKIIEIDERDSIITKFTEAFKRYDCRVFIVDNLLTVAIGAKSSEVYQIQADFVIKLRKFAEKYGVHVHVVVHPRKTPDVKDSDEVGGMGVITNIACNVINVKRCNETERQEKSCDAILRIMKNRAFGDRSDIGVNFDIGSRRFTQVGKQEKVYSWNAPYWEALRDDEVLL